LQFSQLEAELRFLEVFKRSLDCRIPLKPALQPGFNAPFILFVRDRQVYLCRGRSAVYLIVWRSADIDPTQRSSRHMDIGTEASNVIISDLRAFTWRNSSFASSFSCAGSLQPSTCRQCTCRTTAGERPCAQLPSSFVRVLYFSCNRRTDYNVPPSGEAAFSQSAERSGRTLQCAAQLLPTMSAKNNLSTKEQAQSPSSSSAPPAVQDESNLNLLVRGVVKKLLVREAFATEHVVLTASPHAPIPSLESF
jgi:hypothetical protein